MDIWSFEELIYIALIFIWTGFVRTGLGFGGAALGLPLLLLIGESPVYWLPIIGIHLLFFTSITFKSKNLNIDKKFLKKYLYWIIPPALIGVFGLITFSTTTLIIFVYTVAIVYSLIWIFNSKIKSSNTIFDKMLLIIGGYVAGISLTGAPLIVAVAMRYINKVKLRDTLFVLWFILVGIKMLTFIFLSIYIDILFAIVLIPLALIGHIIGLKTHNQIIKNDILFKKIIGGILILVSVIGLLNL